MQDASLRRFRDQVTRRWVAAESAAWLSIPLPDSCDSFETGIWDTTLRQRHTNGDPGHRLQAGARYKALREGKLAQAALACEKLLNAASAEMNKVVKNADEPC